MVERVLVSLVSLALAGAGGCRAEGRPVPGEPTLERVFASADRDGCLLASPSVATSQGATFVVVASNMGEVLAFDPATGDVVWSVSVPADGIDLADITATPALVGGRYLVVVYQTTLTRLGARTSHRVVVVDLETRALAPEFALLELSASKPDADGTGTVDFRIDRSFSRSAVAHIVPPGATLGSVWIGYGNTQDIQPWHGWLFEIDLDAWRSAGAGSAVAAVLLTTPESDCPEGTSGAREMICGAGIWAPAGPCVYETSRGIEIIVPTGNGELNLARGDYANTVLRLSPGLVFDPACDALACGSFDVLSPDPACMASCENLFIPRLRSGDPPLRPESGICDGLSFFECYAALDWDLGADTPERVTLPDGTNVFVLPAKDGSFYLFDADHLGTMYDRLPILPACGTPSDPCVADWAGMFVTKPEIVTIDGAIFAIAPGFMHDRTHGAGVVAVRIDVGPPRLTLAWTAPDLSSAEARDRFRRHPGRLTVFDLDGEPYGVVEDVAQSGNGTLLVIRLRDGLIVERQELAGHGVRYSKPVVHDGVVYAASCVNDRETGSLEAYRIVLASDDAGVP